MDHVRKTLDVSERRACQVLGQPRGTQRYRAQEIGQERKRFVRRMHELVQQHPRYGYRRIVECRASFWAAFGCTPGTARLLINV